MYIHSWMAEGSSYQTTRRTPISDTETKTNLIDNLYECKPVWNPVEAKRLFPKVQVPSPDSLNIFASFPWKTGWFHIKNHPETHENFHCELVGGVRRACFKFLGPTVHNLWRTKPKFSSTGHPQKWWHLCFFSMDSHSSSVWWSTKIWWIIPKKCSLQQCMVSISVSGTDHGSHSKPEQDVRNLEPLLLLGCKARLMYVALLDTLNIPFESGNND